MRNALLLIGVCALFLMGCSESAPLESPSAPSVSDDLIQAPPPVGTPFSSTFASTSTPPGPGVVGCDGDPTTGVFVISGVGIGQQQGLYTFVGDSEVDALGNQCGHSVVTVANGHQYEFDISGTSSPPDANFVITGNGTWTITGGTGRFANATGGGTYTGKFDLLANQGRFSLTGVIYR